MFAYGVTSSGKTHTMHVSYSILFICCVNPTTCPIVYFHELHESWIFICCRSCDQWITLYFWQIDANSPSLIVGCFVLLWWLVACVVFWMKVQRMMDRKRRKKEYLLSWTNFFSPMVTNYWIRDWHESKFGMDISVAKYKTVIKKGLSYCLINTIYNILVRTICHSLSKLFKMLHPK